MGRIKSFVLEHDGLFKYQKAKVVHLHDIFLSKTFLKLIPASVTPNQVTFFRVLATPVVFLIILYGNYTVGIALFVFAAFTDAVDGAMARTQNKITKFGMLFDPLADKFLIGSMILILVFQNFNVWLGIAILGLEIIFIVLSALTLRKSKFKTELMANLWGKIKMILQVLAVCVTLLALAFNIPYLFTIAAGVFGLAIGFALISLFTHGI